MKRSLWIIVMLLFLGVNSILAQTNNNGRTKVALYIAEKQTDKPLSSSVLTVVKNKTITKLINDGNYQLIERSAEFQEQVRKELSLQQFNDMTDGQISKIGKGYDAQKICVVDITIIDEYLYINTRIVDVAAEISYESGDAEATNYNSTPVLTSTLEEALNKMLAKKWNEEAQETKTNSPIIQKTKENENEQLNSSSPINTKGDFEAYKLRLKKEKGVFLDMNSLAFQEYLKYQKEIVAGSTCLALGITAFSAGVPFMVIYIMDLYEYFGDPGYFLSRYGYTGRGTYDLYAASRVGDAWLIGGTVSAGIGLALIIAGAVELGTVNKTLHKSYQYYINGDMKTATVNFHPYFDIHNTMGVGLTLRF